MRSDGNHAILVAISRYAVPEEFKPLHGPANDLARVRAWLTETGEVPAENIQVLATPSDLFADPAPESVEWTPTCEHFTQVVRRMTHNGKGKIRRDGRLYLYFAGHGFSMASDDTPRAAVYAADADVVWPRNFGSDILNAMRRGAYFSEVVLLMDCCRDSQVSREYEPLPINRAENDAAEDVSTFAVYATHKGGKAQEGALPDTEGKVVGLLTHGFLKALAEAPADVLGWVRASTINAFMMLHWNCWFNDLRPDLPRFSISAPRDIMLRSRAALVEQRFELVDTVHGRTVLLQTPTGVLTGTVTGPAMRWQNETWAVEVPIEQDGGKDVVRLQLRPEPHALLGADSGRRGFIPETHNAISI